MQCDDWTSLKPNGKQSPNFANFFLLLVEVSMIFAQTSLFWENTYLDGLQRSNRHDSRIFVSRFCAILSSGSSWGTTRQMDQRGQIYQVGVQPQVPCLIVMNGFVFFLVTLYCGRSSFGQFAPLHSLHRLSQRCPKTKSALGSCRDCWIWDTAFPSGVDTSWLGRPRMCRMWAVSNLLVGTEVWGPWWPCNGSGF